MASRFQASKSTQGDGNERNLCECGNGTSEFSTDRVFKSRQDMMDWVQNVGRSLGFIIVTKRSSGVTGITSKVTLMCDRGGVYKNKASDRHTKVTKKTNCPFELVGLYFKTYDYWTLRVICEKHNHEPAPIHMKDHPYAKRLSDNETRLVLDLSRRNVKPQEILMILKKLNTNNMSTLKTIYNVRQRFRLAGTFIGETIDSEEMASSSPTDCPVYMFDANKSKRTSHHIDPFAMRNVLHGIDLSKYGYDLMVTNPVKDVSVASRVREVLMCHDTNAPDADESTSAGPFQPYRDVVLTKPQGQFLMKQFLDRDYAHDQSSTGKGGTEGVVERQTKSILGDSDDEVENNHDTYDENEIKFAVKGTSEFSTNEVFESRQELMEWVQHVGRYLGYIIVTKRSNTEVNGIMSNVILMCDRGGTYKTNSTIRRKRGTRKTNCPFELVGKYCKTYGFWTLSVHCEKHNHEPAPSHMKGHPYAMRLSDDEECLVVDLLNKNVNPHEILSTLKKHNPNNMSTLKTIYNSRQKLRRAELAGQSSNSEDSASPSPMYIKYASLANKSKRTDIEESASWGPAYEFDANASKRSIDQTFPVDIRNLVQGIVSAEYEPVTEDIGKQMVMPSSVGTFPPLYVDLNVTNIGNGHHTNALRADKVRPFHPYQDAILNKPQGDFKMKQFLDGDYDHCQSLTGKRGRERESVVENQLNTAVQSTDKQDRNVEFVNEYCGRQEYKMETIDLKDYADQYLEMPWLNEEVKALHQRFKV